MKADAKKLTPCILKRDRQERYNTKRAWTVNAWRLVSATTGHDLVQPWCDTKTEARQLAKNLGFRIVKEDVRNKNAHRVGRARMTLRAYMRLPGMSDTTEEALIDLMADLMHLADAEGLNAGSIVRMATNHHKDEL